MELENYFRLNHVEKKEVISWLSDLIKIDTTNPPGNEEEAAKFVASILEKEGAEPELIYSDEKRANVYLKIPGEEGRKNALLLLSHLDVVPAEKDTWEHPPFSGVVKNDEIWGRGALDCKGLVVMELATMVELLRKGFKPKSDLIFLSTPDEEMGGDYGAKFMVENHADKVKVPYMINEGGGLAFPSKKKGWVFLLNNAEKGAFWSKLEVYGTPGHGSMPKAYDNALEPLAKAILLLLKHETKITPTEDFVSQMKGIGGSFAAFILSKPWLAKIFLSHPPKSLKDTAPVIDAMLRMTIAPTVVEASNKTNIIPGKATLQIDVRTLPGQDRRDVEKEIEKALKGKIRYKLSPLENSFDMPGTRSEFDTILTETIKKVTKSYFERSEVVPNLVTGATDSRFFRAHFNTISYGFMPLLLDDKNKDLISRIHGRNERISVRDLLLGTSMIKDIVEQFLG